MRSAHLMSDGTTSGPGDAAGGTTGPGPGTFPGPFRGNAPPAPPSSWPAPLPPPQGGSDPNEPVYASWGIRAGGYVIDFVIFAAITAVLILLMRHSHALEVHVMMKRGADRRRSISLLPFLIAALLYVAYGTVLCGSRRGQTVGMMVVGVRAVRDGTFERLGYVRAGIRALAEGVLRSFELLNPFLILIWFLDFLFPLWDQKRQTIHDKVGRSVVLRAQPPTT